MLWKNNSCLINEHQEINYATVEITNKTHNFVGLKITQDYTALDEFMKSEAQPEKDANIVEPISVFNLGSDFVGELNSALRPYVLSPERLAMLGYPVRFRNIGTFAYMQPRPTKKIYRLSNLNADAVEFVPGSPPRLCYSASGKRYREEDKVFPRSCARCDETFVVASDSDMQLGPMKKVCRSSNLNVDAVEFVPDSPPRLCYNTSDKSYREEDEVFSRWCARCDETFLVTSDGEAYGPQYCRHHWGRLNKEIRYECCNGVYGTLGCNSTRYHVWTGTIPGVNGPLDGYVETKKFCGGVYGIDTEMCYTTAGMELAHVAVVSWDGKQVYNALVKPTSPIVDYNTRFSGIRRRDIERATKTLRDVQDDILKFIGVDTILVGHALDSDLRALKLVHGAVVDTCDLYPHRRGFPFRRSLRELTMQKFRHEIQTNRAGHSPIEDAKAAMDLVLLKIKDTTNKISRSAFSTALY